MKIRVLVVDDSGFFRRRLVELINANPRLEVVGTASNGKEAITQAQVLKPDVITMDYEMPVMDGITAVKEITRIQRTPVLMFSSLTYEGARVTLDALEAGAVDYLPKNFEDLARNSQEVQKILCDRIITIAGSRPAARSGSAAAALPTAATPSSSRVSRTRSSRPALVIIGASTGGPMALQELLTSLPGSFPLPLLLVQHMPGTFTSAFAERLNRLCAITVREAVDGEPVHAGTAYLAPGGRQMLLEGRSTLRLRVIAGDERMNYKPSVDVTFASAAKELGGRVLGIVLTGMGADGREGARLLKAEGARIWTQDEASCVIYGMPMAVFKAGFSDEVHSLKDLGRRLLQEIN